jgi:hypothetical protein
VIEVDLELDPEALRMRPQLAVAIALGNPDRFQDADIAPWHRQRNQADLIDRSDERRGAAIHDRHFRPIDLNDGVVDTEARQRGEHVFGGRTERSGGVAKHGGKFGRGDGADVGGDFAVRLIADPAADEYDSGVSFRREHGQRCGQSRMNANTADRGLVAQGGLPTGFHARIVRPSHARDARSP